MTTGVLANTEATKSLHTSACKLTTYSFVQHVSLGYRDKGHLQAREAQWSKMLILSLLEPRKMFNFKRPSNQGH